MKMVVSLRGLTVLATSLILLTSCSNSQSPSENSASVQSPSASAETKSNDSLIQPSSECSTSEFEGGSSWIEGQLRAFNESEAKVAYGFASENFRSKTSIEQFVAIISTQYPMLLNLKSFAILNCERTEGFFLYNVQLVDKANQTYSMKYLLSLINKKWGVEAASVSSDLG